MVVVGGAESSHIRLSAEVSVAPAACSTAIHRTPHARKGQPADHVVLGSTTRAPRISVQQECSTPQLHATGRSADLHAGQADRSIQRALGGDPVRHHMYVEACTAAADGERGRSTWERGLRIAAQWSASGGRQRYAWCSSGRRQLHRCVQRMVRGSGRLLPLPMRSRQVCSTQTWPSIPNSTASVRPAGSAAST